MFLLLVSFLAGVLSVFAACVLPLLPVVVGGSLASGSRTRVYAIIGSLAASIVAFTLLLKVSTALLGVPEELWRYISGSIIVMLGFAILFPSFWTRLPGISALYVGSNKLLAEGYQRNSFTGDVLMGAALGPVFASCSPTYFIILATVLPAQPALGLVYLLAYALGLALALFLVFLLGEKLIQKLGVTLDPSGWFYRVIGALLIVVGVLVFTGTMKKVEAWFVEKGFDATFLELRILGADSGSAPASLETSFLSPEVKESMYALAPELVDPDGYINTEGTPVTIKEFKDKKIVLIDIWTYSCINCQRTLPYLKMWYEKYRDQGLEIIGVHTPEFAFEKVQANVERAVKEFGLEYPVVLDNEYRTWNAFGNRFWPRKYLVDIDGYIVYDHAGEGAYDDTEQAIQRALAERTERLGGSISPEGIVSPEETISVDFAKVRSPEIYFGSDRNEYLGNGVVGRSGIQTLEIPEQLADNILYLSGTWDIQPEFAESERVGAIQLIYSAKNVYFVASADKPVTIRVTRDGGEPLGNERGSDVGEDGRATITEDRLYKLIEGSAYGTHTIEITIEQGGLKVYTFTFG